MGSNGVKIKEVESNERPALCYDCGKQSIAEVVVAGDIICLCRECLDMLIKN